MSEANVISTRRAVIHSALAVYTPGVAMALYALCFVSSSYAQSMMWKLLPCAPGLLPVETIRRDGPANHAQSQRGDRFGRSGDHD